MSSRLLVADSDHALCDIYRRYFSACGFRLETAADGLECLAKLRDFMPDVLVLEWEMPWGGGEGVLTRLQEDFPLLPIDVVITSSGESPEYRATSLSDQVIGYLRKPFRMAQLLEVVRRPVSRRLTL